MGEGSTARGGQVRRAASAAVALVLAAAALLCALRVLMVNVPGPGLDQSWMAVLGQAATLPARWGVDLTFTYGPASALVTRFYTDGYLLVALPVLCGVALVNGAALARLARAAVGKRRSATALMLVAGAANLAGLAALLTQDQDGFYFALVLTLFLLDLLRRPGDRASLAILACGAALMGIVGLSKTSYAVAALVLFGLADLRAALARARLPYAVPVFLAALLATYLAYGQRLGDLGAYLRLQGEVASGYGEAMYLLPSRGELAGFLLGAAVLAAAVALAVPARAGRLGRGAAVLATAFVLAIGFKAGFVRADGHTQIAWSLLGLAGLAVATGLALPRSTAAAAGLGGASLLVLWVVAPLFLLADTDRTAAPSLLPAVYADMGASLAGEVDAWGRLLRSPAGFAAGVRAAKEAAWAKLRADHPLPALEGGVDILPSEQSAVLASGLDYRPRPSFQDYTTYTAGLIAANAAFYAGPRAPAWVLFDVGGLDDRDPDTAEGALWPDLLRLYEPVRRVGSWLALHRRAVPLPPVLGPAVTVEAALGATVPVPLKGPVYVRITVEKTLLGRIAAALFRPPALSLRLDLVGGGQQTYRFIPAIGVGGFLLSPVITDAEGFADLAVGAGDAFGGAEVGSFAVGGSRWAAPFYGATLSVAFQPVTVAPAPPSPEARPFHDALSAGLPWLRLIHALGRDRDLAGGHLSAPAPTALPIPTEGRSRLRVGFGIEDGAWTGGHTQGVCFAVAAPSSAEPLWRRCLDPAAVPADRGPQSAVIDLPPGLPSATAETTCPKGCDWGWSYWSGIVPED